MFQRVGAAAYKKDLSNTIELLHALNNPENNFHSVHIAGTNGKGSSSHMIASVFQEAEYKTGLYTSPHLVDFRERIRINGEMIPESFVVDFTLKNKELFTKIGPSFFEMTVAMAFEYFKEQNVDIAIIETGMGGRLDSTNVIAPDLCLITNIGFDHTAFLGDTYQAIATEKAGIIKENTPIIISEFHPETAPIFSKIAQEKSAPILFASKIIEVEKLSENYSESICNYSVSSEVYSGNITSPLMGNYQIQNIKGVLAALQCLQKTYPLINDISIQKGLENVKINTGLKGRWEILGKQPLCIADTGHNTHGIQIILNQLLNIPHRKLHIVIGMVNDKDIRGVLNLFPKNAQYYFTQAQIPRAIHASELAEIAGELNLKGQIVSTVKEAFELAKKNAEKEDIIFIGGSTFVAAEIV